MYKISEKNSGEIQVLKVENYYKNEQEYYPVVEFSVCYSEEGFHAKFKTYEKNPKAVATEHFQPVHLDSCVEWFVNFYPEKCDRYFNFETNANGVVNAHFRKDRKDKTPLTVEDANSLNIKTEVLNDYWTVEYTVTFDFIKKFIPDYEFKKGMELKSNVYKCGEETEVPHFGMWQEIKREKPDFHQPDDFGVMVIE